MCFAVDIDGGFWRDDAGDFGLSLVEASCGVEGYDARPSSLFLEGSCSPSSPLLLSSGEAKMSCKSAWSLKLVRLEGPPTLDLVVIGLTAVTTTLERADCVPVRRRFILDARGVVDVSEV